MRAIDVETIEEITEYLNVVVTNSTAVLAKGKKSIYVCNVDDSPVDKALLKAVVDIFNKVKSPVYKLYISQNVVNDDKAFSKNMTALNNADVVVALISHSTTTLAVELGMAKMLNKKIVLLAYDDDDFIHKPNKIFSILTSEKLTINKFAKFLQGTLTATDYSKF